MAQTYGFCADSVCAPRSQAGGEQGGGFVPSVLCSLTSRQCPGRGQTGTGGKWPRLDVVWVAFETVSLLVHVGKGVRGFKTELSLKQPGAGLARGSGDVSGSAVPWGRGVGAAPPSWDCRRIPPFITAHRENSSAANKGGSGAVPVGAVTHSRPGDTAMGHPRLPTHPVPGMSPHHPSPARGKHPRGSFPAGPVLPVPTAPSRAGPALLSIQPCPGAGTAIKPGGGTGERPGGGAAATRRPSVPRGWRDEREGWKGKQRSRTL